MGKTCWVHFFSTGSMGELCRTVREIIPPTHAHTHAHTHTQTHAHTHPFDSFSGILITVLPSGLLFPFRFAVCWEGGFQGLLPCLSHHNSPYFWVIEPMCGFCLRFRISISIQPRDTGEIMGPGFQQSYYE